MISVLARLVLFFNMSDTYFCIFTKTLFNMVIFGAEFRLYCTVYGEAVKT